MMDTAVGKSAAGTDPDSPGSDNVTTVIPKKGEFIDMGIPIRIQGNVY